MTGKKVGFSASGISDHLKGMADRSRLVTGWLNRVAYPKLIAVQRMRWQTEGKSEGDQWATLNPNYREYKLKRFRDYPGGGRKMLVATTRLVTSMTGDVKTEHWKLVQGHKLEVGSKVPYGQYVDADRDTTSLSDETVSELIDGLLDYIVNGNNRKI